MVQTISGAATPDDGVFLSDPVHGFIRVPGGLLLKLLQTPEVQRLRRIRQLGVAFLVFPGAEHSRFTHGIGAMALMNQTLDVLAGKGTPVSLDERHAAMAAALLHDIGHGPFSHTLEGRLFRNVSHEAVSAAIIGSLAARFGGPMDLALKMVTGTYSRSFFHELIASQLDMDRLDYLRRDSQHTGVMEGRIGVERILQTLCVHPTSGEGTSCIAVERKGMYAAEKMFIARHLMYSQVYLHQAVIAGDHLLRSAVNRAKELLITDRGAISGMSPVLQFFLENKLGDSALQDQQVLDRFIRIDDTDVISSLKAWTTSPDKVLADLSRRFLERDTFRCTYLCESPSDDTEWRRQVEGFLCQQGISSGETAKDDARYYLKVGFAQRKKLVGGEESIQVLGRNGELFPLWSTSDKTKIRDLLKFTGKHYVSRPKEVQLDLSRYAQEPCPDR